MAANPVVIELGGQKILWSSDMKVVSASRFLSSSIGNPRALRDVQDADYQVPVGKVFRLLECVINGAGSGFIEGQLYNTSSSSGSATADAIELIGAGENQVVHFATEHNVPAGNYITGDGYGNGLYAKVIGIEMDA